MPIVIISLLDTDRQWFKSRVGLAAPQTSRDVAFCAYTILEETPRVMVVPDAYLDERFRENPLVLGPPYIRFYGGASLIVQGIKVGTLCLIDQEPRHNFSSKQEAILIDIADTVASMMEERRTMECDKFLNGVHMHQSLLNILSPPLHNLSTTLQNIQQDWSSMVSSVGKPAISNFSSLEKQIAYFHGNADHFASLLDSILRCITRVVIHPETHDAAAAIAIARTPHMHKQRRNNNKTSHPLRISYAPSTLLQAPEGLLPLCVEKWMQLLNTLLERGLYPAKYRLQIPCQTNLLSETAANKRIYTHTDLLAVVMMALLHTLTTNCHFTSEITEFDMVYDLFQELFTISLVAHTSATSSSSLSSSSSSTKKGDKEVDYAKQVLGQLAPALATILSWVGGRVECTCSPNSSSDASSATATWSFHIAIYAVSCSMDPTDTGSTRVFSELESIAMPYYPAGHASHVAASAGANAREQEEAAKDQETLNLSVKKKSPAHVHPISVGHQDYNYNEGNVDGNSHLYDMARQWWSQTMSTISPARTKHSQVQPI